MVDLDEGLSSDTLAYTSLDDDSYLTKHSEINPGWTERCVKADNTHAEIQESVNVSINDQLQERCRPELHICNDSESQGKLFETSQWKDSGYNSMPSEIDTSEQHCDTFDENKLAAQSQPVNEYTEQYCQSQDKSSSGKKSQQVYKSENVNNIKNHCLKSKFMRSDKYENNNFLDEKGENGNREFFQKKLGLPLDKDKTFTRSTHDRMIRVQRISQEPSKATSTREKVYQVTIRSVAERLFRSKENDLEVVVSDDTYTVVQISNTLKIGKKIYE